MRWFRARFGSARNGDCHTDILLMNIWHAAVTVAKELYVEGPSGSKVEHRQAKICAVTSTAPG